MNFSITFLKRNLGFFLILSVAYACCLLFVLINIREGSPGNKSFLSRTPFFSPVIKERVDAISLAKSQVLSFAQPSFDQLAQAILSPDGQERSVDSYEHYYASAAKLYPNHADFQGILAYIYYYEGKDEQAIEYFKKALEINPTFFWYNYNLARILYDQKRYPEAALLLQKGLSFPPSLSIDFILSSNVYRFLFMSQPSLKGYPLKEKLMKGYRDGYKIFILSLYHFNKYQEVVRTSQELIEQNMGINDFFYYYAGLASYELNDFKEAARFFGESLKVNPDLQDAKYYLGMSLVNSGEKAKGEKLIQESKGEHVEDRQNLSKVMDVQFF